MFAEFWHDFLYQPLFNALVWIYNNWADKNLGWAIVYLTISLRVFLLPLTFIEEFAKRKHAHTFKEIERIDKEFAKDEVLKKEEIRKTLKRGRIQPWTKFVSLGIQGLVLVLLYQVFVSGIESQRLVQVLYSFVEFPGKLNTDFYGFDLGAVHDIIFPGIVTILLFMELYIGAHRHRFSFHKSDLSYFVLFPLVVFLILWWLPMVKALFVLTSMVFSLIIAQVSKILFWPFTREKKKA